MPKETDISGILIDLVKAAAIAIIGFIVIRGILQAVSN